MSEEQTEVDAFWALAKSQARLTSMPGYFGPTTSEVLPPPAWSFGVTEAEADDLLRLVLDGIKTATAGALWDYEVEDEPLPVTGALGIVVDSQGHPRALIETTSVEVVPFDDVDEEHAFLEGEGDRTLTHWREVHERFFTDNAEHDRGFADDMPVVCERFRVLHQA